MSLPSPESKEFLTKLSGRVFSGTEEKSGKNSSRPAEKSSGMFASNKAVVKALGTVLSEGIHHVHIHETSRGVTAVSFSPEILRTVQTVGVDLIFHSKSHSYLISVRLYRDRKDTRMIHDDF